MLQMKKRKGTTPETVVEEHQSKRIAPPSKVCLSECTTPEVIVSQQLTVPRHERKVDGWLTVAHRYTSANVLYAPKFTMNIISVLHLTSNGNTVSFNNRSMIISNGYIQCLAKPVEGNNVETGNKKVKRKQELKTIKVNFNEAHGHVGLKSLRETAKLIEWELLEQLEQSR